MRTRKAIWLTLGLFLAIAFMVAGAIAGNKEDGSSPASHRSAPSAGQVAEQEFERNLSYEVAEEQLQEEGFSQREAEGLEELAEREGVGARGAIELGGIAKDLPGRE